MGKYTLEELYNQVTEAITSLDFEQIWEGFKPLEFTKRKRIYSEPAS